MRTFLLSAAVAVSAVLLAPMPTSSAQPAAPVAPVVKRFDASADAQHRVAAYWTPDRMRAAIPGDRLVVRRAAPTRGASTGGTPTTIAPQEPTATAASGFSGGAYTGGGAVVKTTGKVFFTLKGVDYVCSGSSTASYNKSLVLTAGHCVNEGPGVFASNFVFVPAYDHGARPYGTWIAKSLSTPSQWATKGDFNHDIGLAVVNPASGELLADVVGAQGVAFNKPRGRVMASFGYPQAAPYDGTTLDWCWGKAVKDQLGGTDQGIKCNLTGGASGGPWYLNFSTTTGLGTTNSVNSYRYEFGPYKDYLFGPYFGDVERATYVAAAK